MAQQVASLYADIGAKIDGFQKGAASVMSSLGNMAISAGAVTAAISIMTETYEIARLGAELDYTKTRFDRLADSVGTTSDVLLSDLREATRGVYSDAELMASAADLMALGLAKSHDEAVRLATVAGGLNMNMNQLVLTLTNMTTMRFDALGVSTDGFKDKMKELEEQGYSTDAAFKEAFLQQAEMQLEKVGHAADTSLGSFMKLEAQVENVNNEFKLLAASALAPVIDEQLDNVDSTRRLSEIYAEMTGDIITSRAEFNMWRDTLEAVSGQLDRGRAMTEYYTQAIEESNGVVQERILTEEEQRAAIEATSDANRDMLGLIGDLQSASESYQEKYADISSDMNLTDDERKAKLQELADEHEQYTRRVVLGLLEQKLMQDGILTDDELNWLLEKGEAWGIYSATVIEEAQKAMNEANALAELLKNLPTEGSFTYFINAVGEGSLVQSGAIAPQLEQRRASGGQVWAGQSYLVGEQGMEVFTPNQNGMITPNSRTGIGGGTDPRIITLLEEIANKPVMNEYQFARILEEKMLQDRR